MIIEPHQPVGASVRRVELSRLEPGEHDQLRDALAEHGVLVMADQHLDDDQFVAFLEGFGELQFTAGERAVPGRTDLNLVTNVGRDRAPVSNWHVDTAYVSSPPAYTALRAVVVPERGGETLFANQQRAWATLDPELRELVADRTMTHVVTGVEPGEGAEVAAAHPLARPHPRTGRPALLLDAPARCGRVSGLPADVGAELVSRLIEWSTRPDNVFRHQWQPGDVVIWDNAVVLHRADHDGVDGDRTFHRGMVGAAGYVSSGSVGRVSPAPVRSG